MPDHVQIDPTREQLDALIADTVERTGPITMVNLLRFDGPGGEAEYRRYCREVQPHLDRVGATPVYAGSPEQVVIGDEAESWWDVILLVSYPSREAFLEMVADPSYREVSEIRNRALSNARLVLTEPWEVGA